MKPVLHAGCPCSPTKTDYKNEGGYIGYRRLLLHYDLAKPPSKGFKVTRGRREKDPAPMTAQAKEPRLVERH